MNWSGARGSPGLAEKASRPQGETPPDRGQPPDLPDGQELPDGHAA